MVEYRKALIPFFGMGLSFISMFIAHRFEGGEEDGG